MVDRRDTSFSCCSIATTVPSLAVWWVTRQANHYIQWGTLPGLLLCAGGNSVESAGRPPGKTEILLIYAVASRGSSVSYQAAVEPSKALGTGTSQPAVGRRVDHRTPVASGSSPMFYLSTIEALRPGMRRLSVGRPHKPLSYPGIQQATVHTGNASLKKA